jgi:hypothetical protein
MLRRHDRPGDRRLWTDHADAHDLLRKRLPMSRRLSPFGRLLLSATLLAWPALEGQAQSPRGCARLAFVDAAADPPSGGGVVDVDPDEPADQNSALAGSGGGNRTLSHVAVAPGRIVYATDLDADPGALGPDPNGGPGRGAVFRLDPGGGPLQVVADGTACGATITNCGLNGVFVEPVGLAWSLTLDRLIVVDPDADPSGLGVDSNGFAGRGGVFAVDPVTGTVELIADGSVYPAGIPFGLPSVFEDPVAVAVGRDGSIWVADQLAIAAEGASSGTIFRIEAATGGVTAVPAAVAYAGLRDVAVEPSGSLLVLDRLAGRSGELLRVDPVMGVVLMRFAGPELVDPVGVVSAGNGEAWLLDAAADPLAAGRFGAVFRLDPSLSVATLVSSTDQYAFPWSLDLLEPEVVDAIAPPSAEQGQTLTLRFTGGTFLDAPSVDLGAGVIIDAVRWLNPGELEVDVTVDAAASVGSRDVRVINPDVTMAFHCDLFEVTAAPSCPPAGPVGDSLRVTRPEEGRVRLAWEAGSDPCVRSFKVFVASEARPAAPPGDFPSDPSFDDISAGDLWGDETDTIYERAPVAGRSEYFLIVPVGSDGSDGASGHY